MSKIDLTAKTWNDIVFEGRNKDYGAYDMRRDSNRRHILALIIVVIVAIVGFSLPGLIKLVTPTQTETYEGTTELDNFKNTEDDKKDDDQPIIPPDKIEQQQVQAMVANTEPVIVPPDQVTNPMEDQNKLLEDPSKMGDKTQDGVRTTDTLPKIVDIPKPAEPEVIVDVAEIMPTFPGGEDAMSKFLSKELVYPASAIEIGLQGRVQVSFVVGKDGNLSDIKIAKSVDYALDEEALRVVKRMSKWIPGKQNGNPVKVRMIIPIYFRLNNR